MKHEYHEGKETVEKMMTQLFRAPKSIAYRFGWPLDFFLQRPLHAPAEHLKSNSRNANRLI